MVQRCLPAHLFLGHMAKALGDLKLAKKCYTHVLELDENHIEAQRELRLMGTKGLIAIVSGEARSAALSFLGR